MRIRIRYALPALLMLAGCATMGSNDDSNYAAAPTVAPPQRVDAVSDALGARMDSMLAAQHLSSVGMTR